MVMFAMLDGRISTIQQTSMPIGVTNGTCIFYKEQSMNWKRLILEKTTPSDEDTIMASFHKDVND